MITKISKINNDNYSVNDSEIPIDKTSVINLGINLGVDNIEEFTDKLDKESFVEVTTAEKGTVVNIYEVDYTNSGVNETQEIQKHLNEKEDLIGQNFFPGVKADDVTITTQEYIPDNEVIKEPDNVTKAKLVLKQSSSGKKYIEIKKEGWREVLC